MSYTIVEDNGWAFGPYTLQRRVYRLGDGGLSSPRWDIIVDDRDLPGIYDNSSYRALNPEFGVNWSAMGTRSSEEAQAYAMNLVIAANAADYFNKIVDNHKVTDKSVAS